MSHPTAWARHYRFVERLEMARQRARHAMVMHEIETDVPRLCALLSVFGQLGARRDGPAGDVARLTGLRRRIAGFVTRCRPFRRRTNPSATRPSQSAFDLHQQPSIRS